MNIRPIICIPTYNNPQTIKDIFEGCLFNSDLPILIIDDGSQRAVNDIIHLMDYPIAIRERVQIKRLDQNRGKGFAIQEAIKEAIRKGFTHLITMDGDGQHRYQDIPKIVDEIYRVPWDLIIGKRKFPSENVPGSSLFGRQFSNFWVKYQTECQVEDSQSGFRSYPLFHVQNLRFFTNRYDFEIEILIRLLWKKVNVREVEIDVIYQPKHVRVSHFNKFKDNVRISILNTILVAVLLLRSQITAKKLAFGVAIGVFVGCTPFIGFHTAIISFIALFFRLNWIILWLGTQISIPPFMPFIFYLASKIGTNLSGSSLGLPYFLIGCFIVGILFGSVIGIFTFLVAYHFQKMRFSKKNWSGSVRGGVIGNWILGQVLRLAGPRIGQKLLFFIVPYFLLFAPKAKKASYEYWMRVAPHVNGLKRLYFVFKHFFTFGCILMDRVYQGFSSQLKFQIVSKGEDHLLKCKNEGLIILCAHVGAFDMASGYLQKFDLFDKINIVKNDPHGFSFEKIKKNFAYDSLQTKEILPNRNMASIIDIKTILAEKGWVAFMVDRPSYQHCELIPFLGGLVPFDSTPFRIAALLHIPVCFCFSFKKDLTSYEFYGENIYSFQYDPGQPKEMQIQNWMEHFAKELEKKVKQYPEQWLNFYPVWSSIPDRHI